MVSCLKTPSPYLDNLTATRNFKACARPGTPQHHSCTAPHVYRHGDGRCLVYHWIGRAAFWLGFGESRPQYNFHRRNWEVSYGSCLLRGGPQRTRHFLASGLISECVQIGTETKCAFVNISKMKNSTNTVVQDRSKKGKSKYKGHR
jgi:hypothetical protein